MALRFGILAALAASTCVFGAGAAHAQDAGPQRTNYEVAQRAIGLICPRLMSGKADVDQVVELDEGLVRFEAENSALQAWYANFGDGSVAVSYDPGNRCTVVANHPNRVFLLEETLVFLSKDSGFDLTALNLRVENPVYVMTRASADGTYTERFLLVLSDELFSIAFTHEYPEQD